MAADGDSGFGTKRVMAKVFTIPVAPKVGEDVVSGRLTPAMSTASVCWSRP